MEGFNKETFAAKFKERDTENTGKITSQNLRTILAQMELDLPQATVNKLVQKMDYYRNGTKYFPTLSNKSEIALNDSKLEGKLELTKQQTSYQRRSKQYIPPPPSKAKEPQDGSDSGSQSDHSSKPDEEYEPQMNVTVSEGLKIVDLVMNKIKKEIWMKTADLYFIQNELIRLANRPSFPIKDPGHFAKINILVGEEKEHYNSFLRAKFIRKPTKLAQSEDNTLKIKIHTSSLEESQFFRNLWDTVFEMVTSMVEGELSDGQQFLKTIVIEPKETQNSFQLSLKSNNPDLNELLQLLSDFPNIVLKTQVKLNLSLLAEFSFDLKEILQNPKASLYDFLTNNIRIKINYQGSEYVSAIKELMIGAEAFKDLSYVSDDEESLQKILLISSHNLHMNLKFKNGSFVDPEQGTLIEFLNIIKEQVRPMIASLNEYSPDLYKMAVSALNKHIQVEVCSNDYFLSAQLNILSLDRLLLEDSPIMENYDQNNSNGSEKQKKKKRLEQSQGEQSQEKNMEGEMLEEIKNSEKESEDFD